MRLTPLKALALLAVVLNGSSGYSQTFRGLGDLSGGSYKSNPTGLSADGKYVVGVSAVADAYSQAFIWSEDQGMVGLGALPNQATSIAMAVSTSGDMVIGHSDSDLSPLLHAVQWSIPGDISPMTGFTATTRGSLANDMTPDGSVIVGRFRDDRGDRAFRWTSSTGPVEIEDLLGGGTESTAHGVSADGTVVVGQANDDRAFRWTETEGTQSLGDLPGGDFFSRAFAVSADGSSIVGEATSALGREAFRWTEAEGMIGLGDLPGGNFDSWANDTTADGSIVIGTSHILGNVGAPDDYDPFIWDEVHGMRNLKDVLIKEYGLGDILRHWNLESADAISDDGRIIVGSGINRYGQQEAWIVALVPEPSSTLLVCVSSIICFNKRWLRK